GPGSNGSAESLWATWNEGNQIVAAGAPVNSFGVVGAFGTPAAAPNSANGNFGDIVIGPAGQVMVTYTADTTANGAGPAQIFVNVDPDGLGAAGFGAQVLVQTPTSTPTQVGGTRIIPA